MSLSKNCPAKLLTAGSAIFTWVSDKLNSAITTAKGYFNGLIDWVKGLPARIATAAGGMWNGIRDGFKECSKLDYW